MQTSHQQFQTVHERAEQHRNDRHSEIHQQPHRYRDKDQAGEGEEDRMSCHDIGKQTDHQGERLGEYAEKLDKRHDWQRQFQIDRCFRPKYLFPVFLCRKQVDSDKRTSRQDGRDRNVAGDVGPSRKDRDDSDQIVDQDKEEDRQQIRGKRPVLFFADRLLDDAVLYVGNNHFHQAGKPARNLVRMSLVPTGGP